jgi:hypothetical protein
MDKFSERMGITQKPMLQVDSMSPELRNSLWNVFHDLYDWQYWQKAAGMVSRGFQKARVDHLPDVPAGCKRWLSEVFFHGPWYEAYNLVEYLHRNHGLIMDGATGPRKDPAILSKWINVVLAREMSAYRFVGETIAPISNEAEIEAIEKAASLATQSGLRGAETHIRAAVKMMSLKPTPDHRNAVKEAISAVESVAKMLANDENATLTPALKNLSTKSAIHPALQAGFSNIYGYTSDANGIRHAILDEPTVDFAEAKYMVVSCSAFVHYLIQKGEAAGLLGKH